MRTNQNVIYTLVALCSCDHPGPVIVCGYTSGWTLAGVRSGDDFGGNVVTLASSPEDVNAMGDFVIGVAPFAACAFRSGAAGGTGASLQGTLGGRDEGRYDDGGIRDE